MKQMFLKNELFQYFKPLKQEIAYLREIIRKKGYKIFDLQKFGEEFISVGTKQRNEILLYINRQ